MKSEKGTNLELPKLVSNGKGTSQSDVRFRLEFTNSSSDSSLCEISRYVTLKPVQFFLFTACT